MDLPARGIAGIIVTALIFSSVMGISIIGFFAGPSHASFAIPSHATILTRNPDGVSMATDNTANKSVKAFISPGAIVARSHSINTSDASPVIKYSVIDEKENALGEHPVLMENSSAHDPSYEELLHFLKNDDTVKNKYVSPNFTCADFAQELQNHAESQGIRCGFAGISFLNSKYGHAMDVFDTTDKGPVYVDTTSGEAQISNNIHPGARYDNMGIISDVQNYW
ncbi:MAG TPA: hypothetical protein VGK13_04230 [Methanocellaceae archaeon]